MFAVSELSQRTPVSVKLYKPQPKKAAGCGGALWDCCSVIRDGTGLWAPGGPRSAAWDVGRGTGRRHPIAAVLRTSEKGPHRWGGGEAGRRAGGGPDADGGICVSVRPPGQPSLGWQLAGLLIESGPLGSAVVR